jgi:hypothetical protein
MVVCYFHIACACINNDASLNSLIDSITSPKVKNDRRIRSWVHSSTCNISKVKGHAGVPGWGLGPLTSGSIIHTYLHKPNNKLVSAYWSTFATRTNHGQTRTHKTHHGLDLGEATTFRLIVFHVHDHKACTQMFFLS